MRKNIIKMMVVAGVAALIIPSAAMAEWDQSELHNNQDDHGEMINVHTTYDGDGATLHLPGDLLYGMESAIGYDYAGDGTATLITHRPYLATSSTPWNTTPCPIQMADPGPDAPDWIEAMGNCPVQNGIADTNALAQTSNGYGLGDNEIYGVILDDLYQSLTEEATTDSNENGQPAFKKVDQVLDILFYISNTTGEARGRDGWTDGVAGTTWYGGIGIDQTLDQDVADIEGTSLNPVGTPFGQDLWAYNHMAQTFYQDFRLFDKGNTFNHGDTNLNGTSSPRVRHGLELLNECTGEVSDCTVDTDEWGLKTLQKEDFGIFDQWVIQSLRDKYDVVGYDGDGIAAPVTSFTSSVVLEQSYSSWMVQGQGGQLCNEVNSEAITDGTCVYVYDKAGHAVDKSMNEGARTHQTGDP